MRKLKVKALFNIWGYEEDVDDDLKFRANDIYDVKTIDDDDENFMIKDMDGKWILIPEMEFNMNFRIVKG